MVVWFDGESYVNVKVEIVIVFVCYDMFIFRLVMRIW